MREQKLTFRPDWEKVVTPIVDYALSKAEIDGDNLAVMGMSLGGYFAARTVAFEHRFRAAIFFDGVYDFSKSLLATMPKDAVTAFDVGDLKECEKITYKRMKVDTNLRWYVTQGIWSFGASGLVDSSQKPCNLQWME
jgi:hypothetical protein